MRKINPNLLKLAEMTHNPELKTPNIEEITKDEDYEEIPDYVYVPSIKLYVQEKRTCLGLNWFECHRELQKEGARMLTLYEYTELFKFLLTQDDKKSRGFLNEIIEVREPTRAEWIDANFKVIGGKAHINYLHVFRGEELIPRYSKEIIGDLTRPFDPGIDFIDWIYRATASGLPISNTKRGSMKYAPPIYDNNSVASFLVYNHIFILNCVVDPFHKHDIIGVRKAWSGEL